MHRFPPNPWADLGPKLMAVAQSWRRVIAQALADEGLSDASALPLALLLREGDGIRQGELAERLGLEGTSVVRVLDNLERDGLIHRQEDPRDRRAKQVFLTEDGRRLARRTQNTFAALRRELLAEAQPADLEATMRVLGILTGTLAVRLERRKG
ncbi:MarR family transcriptional regulator [Roseomonas sp. NAR14]|uniref:MarR family transcriptional regulator n=1 Tax=Roseomonas acroporae TaxID=2937791 RepID=A0A9X1Y692_9PROT|nr:MarR family transcriptional regulator [Roseomonas acroporae]MCK8784281.1 MarR family transcriptional regulator [Roseomonas acroporae]